jgi:hypothetical protein
MIITKEQQAAFADAAAPMIKWLNENCHPHVVVHIETNGAQLYEGIATIKNLAYIKD